MKILFSCIRNSCEFLKDDVSEEFKRTNIINIFQIICEKYLL